MTLPEWIGCVTSLQILSIIDCPHLEKICQKDIAPQSAIPDIENIFSEAIETLEKSLGLIIWVFEEEEEEDFEGKEVREEEKHLANELFCGTC